MTDQEKFLDISFPAKNGGDLKLTTQESLNDWVENEINFWDLLKNQHTGQPVGFNLFPVFQNYINILRKQNASRINTGKVDVLTLKNILEKIKADGLFLSKSIKALAIRKIFYENGQQAAEAAFHVAKNHNIQIVHSLQISAIAKYTILTEDHLESPQMILRDLDEKRQNSINLITQYESKTQKLINLIEESYSAHQRQSSIQRRWQASRWRAFKAEKNDLLQSEIDKLHAVKKAYTEHMNLSAPVTYWKTKATEHSEKAQEIRRVLIVFSLLSTTGVAISLIYAWKHIENINEYGFLPIALFVFITTVLLWTGRIIVRLFLSETHLGIDSKERAIMAQTYLALIKENQVSKEDREILLNALFRPTKDGIIKDDGAPILSPSSFISSKFN